jgi:hypothetical protein
MLVSEIYFPRTKNRSTRPNLDRKGAAKGAAKGAEQRLQMVTLVDGSYCPANRVSLLEESLDNPDRNESICTRNKDFGRGFNDGHFVSNDMLIQRLCHVMVTLLHHQISYKYFHKIWFFRSRYSKNILCMCICI